MSNAAPPPPPPGQYQASQQMSPADEKLWATLVHLGGIVFGFIPALVGYLVLRDRGPFVREHTRSALNFQISYTIYTIAAFIVFGILGIILAVLTFGIGIVIIYIPMVIPIAMIVLMIIAAVKANQGLYYTYPLTIQFIKA